MKLLNRPGILMLAAALAFGVGGCASFEEPYYQPYYGPYSGYYPYYYGPYYTPYYSSFYYGPSIYVAGGYKHYHGFHNGFYGQKGFHAAPGHAGFHGSGGFPTHGGVRPAVPPGGVHIAGGTFGGGRFVPDRPVGGGGGHMAGLRAGGGPHR